MPEKEILGLVFDRGQFLYVPVTIEEAKEPIFLLVNTGERYSSLSPLTISMLETEQDLRPSGFNSVRGERRDWYLLTVQVGDTVKRFVRVYSKELPDLPGTGGILGMNWFRLEEPKVNRITLDFERRSLGLDFS